MWLTEFDTELSVNHVLIWLLTTPSHVKYVARLPCNLPLITFSDINVYKVVWQHLEGVASFRNNRFTTNLPRNLPVNFFCKSVKIWQNYGWSWVCGLAFLAHPMYRPYSQRPCGRQRSIQSCLWMKSTASWLTGTVGAESSYRVTSILSCCRQRRLSISTADVTNTSPPLICTATQTTAYFSVYNYTKYVLLKPVVQHF